MEFKIRKNIGNWKILGDQIGANMDISLLFEMVMEKDNVEFKLTYISQLIELNIYKIIHIIYFIYEYMLIIFNDDVLV